MVGVLFFMFYLFTKAKTYAYVVIFKKKKKP